MRRGACAGVRAGCVVGLLVSLRAWKVVSCAGRRGARCGEAIGECIPLEGHPLWSTEREARAKMTELSFVAKTATPAPGWVRCSTTRHTTHTQRPLAGKSGAARAAGDWGTTTSLARSRPALAIAQKRPPAKRALAGCLSAAVSGLWVIPRGRHARGVGVAGAWKRRRRPAAGDI